MMKKRGQAGEVIKYAFIALVVISIQFFGYKAFVAVREKMCQTEMAKFEVDLSNLDKGVKFGSVEEKTFGAPCNVDEIYFVDLEKDIDLDIFNKTPLIKDSLKSGIEKNLFLVKDNELKKSFYSGNFDISYPHFQCIIPKNERIDFFLEGLGRAVRVVPGCEQPVCTYLPITTTEEKARGILTESTSLQNINVDDEINDFTNTVNNVELFRKFSFCSDTGITDVEIVIKPKKGTKLENFKFYEQLPKDCIDNLNSYLENIQGDYTIKADPLIVWNFASIEEEEKVSYQLNADLTEECKKLIEGLGIAKAVEGGIAAPAAGTSPAASQGPVGVTINNAPVITSQPATSATEGIEYFYNVIASDPDNDILDYSLITKPNGMSINSQIGLIRWVPENSQIGGNDVKVRVSDGEEDAEQEFTVNVASANKAPTLSGIPDQILDGNIEEHNNIINLIQFASDDKTPKPQLIYRIISQSNTDLAECSIDSERHVDCDVEENENGFSDITVEAEDEGGLKGTDTFKVNVEARLFKLVCSKKAEEGCVENFDDECEDYSRGERIGNCCLNSFFGICVNGGEEYRCYDDYETSCSQSPSCGADLAMGDLISCS